MLRIPCPHCGLRPHFEFAYGGDATVTPPDGGGACEWSEFLYYRDNPKGAHRELWYHRDGCRQWLELQRNTHTHAVGAAASLMERAR